MNAHPEWAGKYSALKSELVQRHPDSIQLDIDGKDSFIKAIDELASQWRGKNARKQSGFERAREPGR